MVGDDSSDAGPTQRRAVSGVLAVALALAVLVGSAGAVGSAGTVGSAGAVGSAGTVGSAGAVGGVDTAPAFVVSLSASGDANVALAATYDLTSDDERAAFASLRDDAAAREELAARFRDRLQRVATAAENRTGRSMAVHHVTASVSTTDGGTTGVVTLRAVWEGLAAVDGDRLVVTEPFASGFSPDRRFVVAGPEGYRVGSVAPSADDRGDRRVAWAAGTALDGFEATFVDETTPTATASGGTPTETHLPDGDSPVPGFGPAAGAVAMLAGALFAARRWG